MRGGVDSKHRRLMEWFKAEGSVLVAFSGGVDSSVLAKVSFDALGDASVAVTVVSPTSDQTEVAHAGEVAAFIGIRHVVAEHDELASEDFRSNPPDRCYFCKRQLAARLKSMAGELGLKTVVEGTNADELKGHRPGFRALGEAGVASPLAELGFSKDDVRALAKRLGLPNAGKPSTACLASRIPYGTRITPELLSCISQAESVVRSFGVNQLRVRCLDDVAVIEVLPEEFGKIAANGSIISKRLTELGFNRVTLDLAGYRSGSMNYSNSGS